MCVCVREREREREREQISRDQGVCVCVIEQISRDPDLKLASFAGRNSTCQFLSGKVRKTPKDQLG